MSFGRFERMVGIPEDEYHQLKTLQRTSNPIQDKFLSLQDEYRQESFIKDPQTRVMRQGETLNEMLNLKDELRSRLIQVTPRPYRTRAQSLFHHIADKVSVNARGELKDDDDGTTIDGSNIADLIQHAVRDRRRNIVPTGWKKFLTILRKHNTPQMILNYDTLEEMQAKSPAKESFKRKLPIMRKKIAAVRMFKSPPSSPPQPTQKQSKRTRRAPKRLLDDYLPSKKEKKYF